MLVRFFAARKGLVSTCHPVLNAREVSCPSSLSKRGLSVASGRSGMAIDNRKFRVPFSGGAKLVMGTATNNGIVVRGNPFLGLCVGLGRLAKTRVHGTTGCFTATSAS